MPEGFPETIEQKEDRDPEYEQLLQTVRDLKAAGVKSLSKRTPETAAFHDALEQWRHDREMWRMYVKTMEKAKAFVRNARLLLDAGQTGGSNKRNAAKFIEEAFVAAHREHDSQEILDYLETELDRVDSPNNWPISPDADVSALESLPFNDAMVQIGNILHYMPVLKRKRFASLKERLIAIRERLRAKAGMPPTPPYRP